MKAERLSRALLVFLHDVLVAGMAWVLAYLLRFNFSLPEYAESAILHTLPWVLLLQSAIFFKFGLYQGIWRFASIPDLKRILKAVGVAALVVGALLPFVRQSYVVPRSVLLLDPILLVVMMGGSRFLYRAWKEHHLYGTRLFQGEPVIVLGAGNTAVSLLKELERSRDWRVVGLLDDNGGMHGRHIYGVKVLGSLSELPAYAARMRISHAILAMPSVSHSVRRRAIDIAEKAGLGVLTVPSFDDLASGKVSVSQVRRVEVEDLLGRDPVQLDDAGLHTLFSGRVVMVTGAGGSIGSELCRQISRFNPETLVLFELNEFALYQLEQELRESLPRQRIACVIGDVRNTERVTAVLRRFRPQIVFHAAAYKHVPLMEWENVSEALANNVLGTHTVAAACQQLGVEKMVLVSTDKAVNPTNVMGASKRLAEMVCQGLQGEHGTRFVMVRFGNVLGSSGSVIPKFREQIAKGGPVTVTHPEVTRYFMSIPEAAQLVLQAGLMGEGGEIFVLDMGEPILIDQLAREMIRLSGFTGDDIKIVYTGLRPGEKLYEELLADDEHTLPTPHPKLRIARARDVRANWVADLLHWVKGTVLMEESIVKQDLKTWVEEYTGDINGISLGSASVVASTTVH
jgi:FlaA1/EpsC-like NDP-sugar epimerase